MTQLHLDFFIKLKIYPCHKNSVKFSIPLHWTCFLARIFFKFSGPLCLLPASELPEPNLTHMKKNQSSIDMASMSSITEQYVLAKWTLALTDKISTDSKCNASAATLSTLAAIYALLEPEVAIVNMSKCQLNLTDPEIRQW